MEKFHMISNEIRISQLDHNCGEMLSCSKLLVGVVQWPPFSKMDTHGYLIIYILFSTSIEIEGTMR